MTPSERDRERAEVALWLWANQGLLITNHISQGLLDYVVERLALCRRETFEATREAAARMLEKNFTGAFTDEQIELVLDEVDAIRAMKLEDVVEPREEGK